MSEERREPTPRGWRIAGWGVAAISAIAVPVLAVLNLTALAFCGNCSDGGEGVVLVFGLGWIVLPVGLIAVGRGLLQGPFGPFARVMTVVLGLVYGGGGAALARVISQTIVW